MAKALLLLIAALAFMSPAFCQTTKDSFTSGSPPPLDRRFPLSNEPGSAAIVEKSETTVYVDAKNLARWAGTDPGAWINSAIAALPTLDGYAVGIVDIERLAGATPPQTTPVVIQSPFIRIIGPGKSALVLRCDIDGPCWDLRVSPFTIAPAGSIGGFTLLGEGTAHANSVGIETGDRIGSEFYDLAVDNFLGTNSSGFWINNTQGFFERNSFFDIELGIHGNGVQNGNTKNIRITNSGGRDNQSFEYNTFIAIRMTVQDAQTGWSVEGNLPNPPFLRGNDWEGSSNMYAGGTLFSFTGAFSSPTTLIQDSNIQWTSECTGCVADSTRFRLDPNVIVAFTGQVSGAKFAVDRASGAYLENLFVNDPSAETSRAYSDSRMYSSSNVQPGGLSLNNRSNTVNGLGTNVSLTAFNAKGIWGTEYVSKQVANQYWCLTDGSDRCIEKMRLTPAGLQTEGHLNQYTANTNWGVCTFKTSTSCTIKYGAAFTTTPTVILTPLNPGSITVQLTTSSATGFTITASRSTSISVNWAAFGNPN